MEDLKNLVIQSLETRGVLGQIRAKLRSSVFKIVDEQDQKLNMGCGLNWENTALYKVADTKVGTLIAEIIREFMEHLRMDYSLSVFIPECSISPERLNKEEILSKCGIKNPQLFSELPLFYYILYFFIYNLISNPENEKFFSDIEGKEIEKNSEQIIENNLRNYYAQKNVN
jgi:hypothetical protein